MCKVSGRFGGDASDDKEVRLLNRIIRWTPEGLRYEVDPGRVEQLARDLEERGAAVMRRRFAAPGAKRSPEDPDNAVP
eukprot:5444647-Lingulodinium_polyedra.AAC.1